MDSLELEREHKPSCFTEIDGTL